MQGLKELLLQEKKHLENIITKASADRETSPDGRLRISVDGGKLRYYHCLDDRYGVYIPRENDKLPRGLAQKAYEESVIKAAEKRLKSIDRCLRGYSDDEIELLYESLHPERKALVTPVEPTVKMLEEQWYSESYKGKMFQEGTAVILSEKGERVRSKSEKILADYFLETVFFINMKSHYTWMGTESSILILHSFRKSAGRRFIGNTKE